MSDRCNAQHWSGTDPVGTSMQCVLDRPHENPHEDVGGRWWTTYPANPVEPPLQREGEEKRSAATQCDVVGCNHPPEVNLTKCRGHEGGFEISLNERMPLPYTTDTSRLEKSQSGFIMCRVCESVQPAAGHECERISTNDEHAREGDLCRLCGMLILSVDTLGLVCSGCSSDQMRRLATRHLLLRAEHAESLLCAMAFDHQRGEVGPSYSNCGSLFCAICDVAGMVP